jgi:hypothetical protein
MRTGFWWRDVKEGDHLEDLGVDGRMIIKIEVEQDGMAWIGLIWLKSGTGGELL